MALSLASLNTVLATEANRLGPTIARKTVNLSIWSKLIKQAAWPDEMGAVISMLIYQRGLPATPLNWSAVQAATLVQDPTDQTARQIPVGAKVNFATKLRQYGLQHSAIESPLFDVTGLRFSFKRKEQLDNIYQILEESVRYSWDVRKRDEYVRLSERKIVVAPGLPESNTVPPALGVNDGGYVANSSAFVQTPATSELTQSVLTKVRQQLLRSGARNNPLGMESGNPVFGLICSAETSDRLIRQDPDARQDIRWAEPSDLVKPLGVERSFKGFYHMLDDTMPRLNIVAGAYVFVPYWIQDPVTSVWEYNPAYEYASYETSIIFQQDTYTMLVPGPETSGGNTKFDAQNFRGDFRFLNVANVDPASNYYNPDGTRGFFRGILASGSQPIRPEYGVVFIHQRPMQQVELIDATGNANGEEGVITYSPSQFAFLATTNSTTTIVITGAGAGFTGTPTTAVLTVGHYITGAGIPAGATVASITNATTFVISAAATASATNVAITTSFVEIGD